MKYTNVMIGAAWLLYAASWFIPTVMDFGPVPGWFVFLYAPLVVFDSTISGINRIICFSTCLANLLMIASPMILRGRFDRVKSTLPWLLILAAVLNSLWLLWEDRSSLPGYFLWWASFFILAVACFLKQRMNRAAPAAAVSA